MRIAAISALFLCSLAASADQVFLDGFPDVPLLEGMTEETADRVVFDAPSGTVAQTAIRAGLKGNEIIEAYAKELPAFGWSCTKLPTNMKCTREQNTLVFLNENASAQNGFIILRLEPVG